MSSVQGHCDPQFKNVQELLQKFVETGEECGAAITVNQNGKNVIDMWAGYTDKTKTTSWQEDTIVNVWSSTKTVSSLAVLMLVDRGLVTLNTKVGDVWPAFKNNGKENIEVRMIISHTSGLSGWEEPVTTSDLLDTDHAISLLEKQKPWWEPGTASGYHAWSYGPLISGLVKHVTGKILTEFVADEIAGPLRADFQIGCREKDWARTATLDCTLYENPAPLPFQPGTIPYKTLCNPVTDPNTACTPAFRRSEQGGVNGHTTARALNKVLSTITLGGEVDGVRLLKPETIEAIFQEQSFGPDLAVLAPLRFGTGFGLPGPGTALDWVPSGKVCMWLGFGGSTIIMDLERKLTIAYVMNRMGEGAFGNNRNTAYVKAIYEALGVEI